jgi:methyl-accepting chemotaxis protein
LGAEEQSAQTEEISITITNLNQVIAANAAKSDQMIEEAESVKNEIGQGNDYINSSIKQSNKVKNSN